MKIETWVLLENNGGCVTFFDSDDFSSLFATIWCEIHFPWESQIINFSQVIIQFICRCVYIMSNKEEGCVIHKLFNIRRKAGL